MSADRQVILSPAQRHLKRLLHRLIDKVGGVERGASYCRLGKSQLSDCCNPNVLTFAPLDVIEDLEAVAGEPIVTRHLAHGLGFELVRLPSATMGDTVWNQRAAKMLKEGGDLISGIGDALETDNDIDPDEAEKLVREGEELLSIVVETLEALKRRAAGQF